MQNDKGPKKNQLPRIVLDLAGLVSYRDQNKQPAGPMTALAALQAKAERVMELGSDDDPKFAGVVLLRDFAKRVMDDYVNTWNALDALEQGTLIQLPAGVEAKEPKDVDHPDGDGTVGANSPTRG